MNTVKNLNKKFDAITSKTSVQVAAYIIAVTVWVIVVDVAVEVIVDRIFD